MTHFVLLGIATKKTRAPQTSICDRPNTYACTHPTRYIPSACAAAFHVCTYNFLSLVSFPISAGILPVNSLLFKCLHTHKQCPQRHNHKEQFVATQEQHDGMEGNPTTKPLVRASACACVCGCHRHPSRAHTSQNGRVSAPNDYPWQLPTPT